MDEEYGNSGPSSRGSQITKILFEFEDNVEDLDSMRFPQRQASIVNDITLMKKYE
jgi:hypothetical protein